MIGQIGRTSAKKAKGNLGEYSMIGKSQFGGWLKQQSKPLKTQRKGAKLSNIKEKEIRFREGEFEKYVEYLLSEQEGVCALTGIPLVLDRQDDDKELMCSLDRIDSNGHYEKDNLQIVCRFVNRWKGDDDDDEFRRLVVMIQQQRLQ